MRAVNCRLVAAANVGESEMGGEVKMEGKGL